MRKYIWLIGILIVALLAVTFVAGCGGKKASTTAGGVATTTSAPAAGTAGAGAATVGDLLKKQGDLTSYAMTMTGGPVNSTMKIKMAGGKPLAMKMDMGAQGFMLVQMDKKTMYMVNPKTNTAMTMPFNTNAAGGDKASSATSTLDALKAMAGAKVSDDSVDGVACLKVISADGKSTYWCEKEHGLPVQSETPMGKIKFKYDQINAVPDSEFELPAGVKAQAMPSMPKMPGGANMPKMPANMPKMPGGG